jgi:hypothetical protein
LSDKPSPCAQNARNFLVVFLNDAMSLLAKRRSMRGFGDENRLPLSARALTK